MQVSLKYGFAFLCTPKCASNSIEAMLRPHIDIDFQGSPQVRHTNVRQYRQYVAPYLDAIAPGSRVETLAVVREPLSWLYSWYRFRARSELRAQNHVNSTAHLSFEEFVAAYLEDPTPEFARVGSQADFLLDDTGRLGVDRLFAYENVQALVDYLAGRVGVSMSLRAINVSPTRVYRSNLLERAGAIQRRIRSRFTREARVVQVARPESVPALAPGLEAALRARIGRDLELHQAAHAAGEGGHRA